MNLTQKEIYERTTRWLNDNLRDLVDIEIKIIITESKSPNSCVSNEFKLEVDKIGKI